MKMLMMYVVCQSFWLRNLTQQSSVLRYKEIILWVNLLGGAP